MYNTDKPSKSSPRRQQDAEIAVVTPKPPPPSWSSLPHKGQLAIITSIRIVDFFQQASLQAFMYHQLQSFSTSAPDSQISFQAGVLQGVFTAAQIFTGVIWGRVADASWGGRKTVILIGLTGTGISCVGMAFSRSFGTVVAWRCLGGAINGTVGAARTTLAETVEKKYHSRAFLLLPLAFNIANIFGPILGGLMADPVTTYPDLFGPNSTFGGQHGVGWLTKFPYAAPNLLSAVLLFLDAALIWFGLRETQPGLKMARNRGLEMVASIKYTLHKLTFNRFGYTQVGHDDLASDPSEENLPSTLQLDSMATNSHETEAMGEKPKQHSTSGSPHSSTNPSSPFLTILRTPNVLLVLLTTALFDFQMGGFASLWMIFLSSSRRPTDPSNPLSKIHLPFHFTGGLAFSPTALGLAMSLLGAIGIALQFLLYPRVNARFGLIRSTRISLTVFPIAYAVAPYLSLMTSSGGLLWAGILFVLLLQVGARTFALPGSILLINNSAPHPSLLGTVHGLGASTSSAFRTIGPIVAGKWYGIGLEHGMVGLSWWAIAGVSCVGAMASCWAKDGSVSH